MAGREENGEQTALAIGALPGLLLGGVARRAVCRALNKGATGGRRCQKVLSVAGGCGGGGSACWEQDRRPDASTRPASRKGKPSNAPCGTPAHCRAGAVAPDEPGRALCMVWTLCALCTHQLGSAEPAVNRLPRHARALARAVHPHLRGAGIIPGSVQDPFLVPSPAPCATQRQH